MSHQPEQSCTVLPNCVCTWRGSYFRFRVVSIPYHIMINWFTFQVQQAHPGAHVQQAATGPGAQGPRAPPSTQQEADAIKAARNRKFNMIAFGLSAVVILIGVIVSYYSIAAPADTPQKLAEEIAKAFNAGKQGGGEGGPTPAPGGHSHDEH